MIVELCNGIEISYPKNCGNAPKKILLANLYKAIACNEYEFIYENVNDDISWVIVGDKKIIGIEKMLEWMKNHVNKLSGIQIDNVITHGNVAAVNGTMDFKNGFNYAFADIYRFSGFGKKAKIKEITSYYIGHDKE